jgi:hypothetical protein
MTLRRRTIIPYLQELVNRCKATSFTQQEVLETRDELVAEPK